MIGLGDIKGVGGRILQQDVEDREKLDSRLT